MYGSAKLLSSGVWVDVSQVAHASDHQCCDICQQYAFCPPICASPRSPGTRGAGRAHLERGLTLHAYVKSSQLYPLFCCTATATLLFPDFFFITTGSIQRDEAVCMAFSPPNTVYCTLLPSPLSAPQQHYGYREAMLTAKDVPGGRQRLKKKA